MRSKPRGLDPLEICSQVSQCHSGHQRVKGMGRLRVATHNSDVKYSILLSESQQTKLPAGWGGFGKGGTSDDAPRAERRECDEVGDQENDDGRARYAV